LRDGVKTSFLGAASLGILAVAKSIQVDYYY